MDFTASFIGVKGYDLIKQLTGKGMASDTAYGFLNNSLDSVVRGLQKLDLGALMSADSATQMSSLLGHIVVPSLANQSGISDELACRSLKTIIPYVFDFLRASEPLVMMPARQHGQITAELPTLIRTKRH